MKSALFLFVLAFSLRATAQPTILLQESFGGSGLPQGWSIEAAPGSDGWRFGTSEELSSLATLVFPEHGRFAATNDETCNCNKNQERLVLPSLNFAGHANVFLLFDSYFRGFSYNGIAESAVVQVSTNGGESWTDVFVVPAFNGWKRYAVNLSAYANAASATIAFRYSDGGTWNLGWGVDEVVILSPPPASVQLLSFIHRDQEYLPVGSHPVTGKIVNLGANPLAGLRFALTLNGTTILTETVSGLNVAPFDTADFYLNGSLTVSSPIMYQAELRISLPNGQNDPVSDDDAIAFSFGGLSSAPARRVLLEAHTGAYFGDCPPVSAMVQNILNSHPQALAYSMHHADNFATMQSDTFRSAVGLTIFPSATVDRRRIPGQNDFFVRPAQWNAAVQYRQTRYAPASVEIVQ
ncbi:MAG: choice-of-anchor J domain-containing protein, partial [Bacteroidia bacterium]|nr:choice-of-anchor J domain-containing protein [Bacteroidia bacterium]MDW8335133.1 choice-of-anchor J domain-containing protein [Bacteroidia bacterium]